MTIELSHKGLAKAHHFMIAFTLGVEVRSALGPAHRQTSQRVFKGLFKCQKFEHAFRNRRVKADATFVGTNCIVVLHTPTALHANVAVIILPANAE